MIWLSIIIINKTNKHLYFILISVAMSEAGMQVADNAMRQLLRQENLAPKTNAYSNAPAQPTNYNSQSSAPTAANQSFGQPTQGASYSNNQSVPHDNNQFLSPGYQPGFAGAPNTIPTTKLPGRGALPTPYFNGPLPTIAEVARSRLMEVPQFQRSRIIESATQLPVQQMSSSKIEYIPFNRKIVQYVNERTVTRVPKTRKVVEYRDERITDVIPREVTKKDYYAIEHLRQYVPEYIPEVTTQMVQRPVPFKRIEYVPVTRQVYHGAPFGSEGLQNVPFCTSNMMGLGMYGMQGPGWQTNFGSSGSYGASNARSLAGIYGGPLGGGYGPYGTTMYQGGWLASGCCDQFKSRFSSIYDSYDPYIPAFKY